MTDLYYYNLTRSYGDGSGSKYQSPAKAASDYLREIAGLKVEMEKAEKKLKQLTPDGSQAHSIIKSQTP